MVEITALTQHIARVAQPIENTPRVMQFLETRSNLVDVYLGAHSMLIDRFNKLVRDDSPYLILFPFALQLKRTLESHRLTRLPTMPEMKTQKEWVFYFCGGVRNAVRLMLNGQEQRKGLVTYEASQRIDAASRTDVDESALIAGSMSHFIEQTMFAWLKNKANYTGTKDEIIHPLENMALRLELELNHSPLFDEFAKLGWIRKDRMEELQLQYEQLNRFLKTRERGTLYVRGSFYENLRRVSLREDLTEKELGILGFAQIHPLDFFIAGNALFCVVRQEIWRNEKGGRYTHSPMPLLEVVAVTHPGKPIEFHGDLFNNDIHPNDKKGIFYFYYRDEHDDSNVRLLRSPSWQFHDYDDNELKKLGTNAEEVEKNMSRIIKQNPQRQFLLHKR